MRIAFVDVAKTVETFVYSGSKAFFPTWSDSLTTEMTPKSITVEHVHCYASPLFSERLGLG